MPMLHCIFDWD